MAKPYSVMIFIVTNPYFYVRRGDIADVLSVIHCDRKGGARRYKNGALAEYDVSMLRALKISIVVMRSGKCLAIRSDPWVVWIMTFWLSNSDFNDVFPISNDI